MPNIGAVEGTLRIRDEFSVLLEKAAQQIERTNSRVSQSVGSINASFDQLSKSAGVAAKSLSSHTEAGSKLVKSLDSQIRGLKGLDTAYRGGHESLSRFIAQQRIENALASAGVTAHSAQGRAIADRVRRVDELTASIKRQQAALDAQNKTVTTAASSWNTWQLKATVAAGVTMRLVQELIQAEQINQRINNTLMVATGSFQGAANEMSFFREEAQRLGLDVSTTGVEYAKFLAAVKGTKLEGAAARDVFVAVAEASTALSLSSEQTTGALNALMQMVSKGNVMAEELRGQFGERIPGAFAMAARAMGVTEQKLNKMLEQSQVAAVDLLPKLADEMRKTFGPGVELGAQGLNAELNRLKTVLFDLKVAFAEALDIGGVAGEASKLVQAFASASDSGSLLGQSIAHIGTVAESTIGVLGRLLGVLGQIQSVGNIEIAGLKLSDATPLAFGAEALDTIVNALDSAQVAYNAWEADTSKSVSNVWDVFKLFSTDMNLFKQEYTGTIRDLANISEEFVGPPVENYEQKNARIVKSNKELVDKIVKGFSKVKSSYSEYENAMDRANKKLDREIAENQRAIKAAELLAAARLKGKEAVRLAHIEIDKMNRVASMEIDDLVKANPLIADKLKLYMETSESAKELAATTQLMVKVDENRVYMEKKLNEVLAEREREEEKARRRMSDAILARSKMLAGVQSEIDALDEYMIALQKGSTSLVEWEARQMAIAEQLSNPDAFIANGNTLEELTAKYVELIKKQKEAADAQVSFGDVMRDFDFADEKIDSMADGIGKMWEGMKELADATKLFAKDTAAAWASVIEGAQAVMEAAGMFQTGNGGGFGGSSEGNYGAEGAMVGAVIGAIVGTMMGGMTQAGMAIGSAAGGMLGSMIKKGADQALANLEWDAVRESFSSSLLGVDKALAPAMRGLTGDIVRTLQGMLDAIGAEIVGLPMVSMKIRDGMIGVVVGGVKGIFQDMGDAVSFAVAELLKQGQLSGIDKMIEAALKGATSESLESLASDLDKVMQVLSFGLTDSQNAIMSFTTELDGMRSLMKRLIGDSTQLSRALNNITIEEGRRWTSLRNQITGHQQSQAEIRAMKEQDALMFNAEKALRLAELRIQKQSLEAKIQIAQADGELRIAQLDLDQGALNIEASQFGVRADLVTANADLMRQDLGVRRAYIGTSYELLAAQLAALDQLIGVIAAIPDIDLGEINLPNVNTGGMGGGISAIEDLNNSLTSLGLESVALDTRMSELAETLRHLTENGAITAAQLAELGQMLFIDIISQMASVIDDQATLQELEQIRFDIQKANWLVEIERLKLAGAINDEQYQRLMGYINALPDNLPTTQAADALAAVNSVIDSMGSNVENLRDRFAELQQNLLDMVLAVKDGTLSHERYAEIIAEVARQTEASFASIAAGLAEQMGLDEAAADFRAIAARAEFAFKVAELQFLYNAYLALGNINKEILMQMQAFLELVADPANWPDFETPEMPDYNPPDTQQEDPTDPLLDMLIASIRSLEETLERYNDFLASLERGPLSGATLRQQFESAQSDFMEMLAAAQSGDMEAIQNLPDMASEFLNIAGQYLDPSSAAYQQLLAMVQQSMGGIAGGMRDIIEAAPSSALGEDGILDTIAQILAAMASRWGVNPGWNTGNVTAGNFGWTPTSSAPMSVDGVYRSAVVDAVIASNRQMANAEFGIGGGMNGSLGNSGGPLVNAINSMRDDVTFELRQIKSVGVQQIDETRVSALRRDRSSTRLSNDRVA